MGFRCTLCLDPNNAHSEITDQLIYKTSKLSAIQSFNEYNYVYADDDDGSEEYVGVDEDDDEDDVDPEDASSVIHAAVSSIRYSGSIMSARNLSRPVRPKPFFKRYSKYNYNGKAIIYACRECLTHLSASNLIISDRYRGCTGDALLMYGVVNVDLGPPQEKGMVTGQYTVCDLNCKQCGKYLGWKYIKSSAARQKFKEGRYILEQELIEEIH